MAARSIGDDLPSGASKFIHSPEENRRPGPALTPSKLSKSLEKSKSPGGERQSRRRRFIGVLAGGGISDEMAAPPARLFVEPYVGDRHGFVDGFARVVDGKGRNR